MCSVPIQDIPDSPVTGESPSANEDTDSLPVAQRRSRRQIHAPQKYDPVHEPKRGAARAFAIGTEDEPTLKQAMESEHWPEWLAAIYEELESLKEMGVYEEVDQLPLDRKAVGSKWVFRLKRDEHGEIVRHKARLVAQGYTQIPGQDFNHTFAPVARWDSIRFILSLTAIYDWELRHLDVKTAFLNGILKEEVYLRRPEILGHSYWRLIKALYGLKQSGREWYLDIDGTYQEMNYTRCESDWSVHRRREGNNISVTATSVDDILHATNSKAKANNFIEGLKSKYQITDIGEATWILGCRITQWRSRGMLKLDQERYAIRILQCYGMENCNAMSTPMASRLTSEMSPKTEEERGEMLKYPYRELVGKLMYLATCTWPDIAFTVRELTKFMSNYGCEHWQAAKHLLRYLQGTRSLGIIYGHKDEAFPLFKGFTDSDWAQGELRKSVCGYVIEMGRGGISWSSKQQSIVALSSCEAEYVASMHAAKQILWLRSLAEELGFSQEAPTVLSCDNLGTIACTHDPHHHSRMKHINIRYHFVRDCALKFLIEIKHIPRTENVADLLTKPLPRVVHQKWIK